MAVANNTTVRGRRSAITSPTVRGVKRKRGSQITFEDVAQIAQILAPERLIEAESGLDLLARFRRHVGVEGEEIANVAGLRVDQEEHRRNEREER